MQVRLSRLRPPLIGAGVAVVVASSAFIATSNAGAVSSPGLANCLDMLINDGNYFSLVDNINVQNNDGLISEWDLNTVRDRYDGSVTAACARTIAPELGVSEFGLIEVAYSGVADGLASRADFVAYRARI
jgi:hypothetical protein